jgi:hypothetical protein
MNNDIYTDCKLSDFLTTDDKLNGETDHAAEKRILTKAARCLVGYQFEATFTGPELSIASIAVLVPMAVYESVQLWRARRP